MKTTSLLGLLMLSAASLSAAPAVIFEETFEQPTGETYLFPPPEGVPIHYHGKFNAWTKEGVLSLTYGKGEGTKGSGGMLLTISKVGEAFMFMSQSDISLPISDPVVATPETIETFVLSFDAKIPVGKRVQVSIEPKAPDASLKERAAASRLVFATITGTGEFVHYDLKAATIPSTITDAFVLYLRDLSAKGKAEALIDIRWALLGRSASWTAGDTIQLDNLKLTSGQ